MGLAGQDPGLTTTVPDDRFDGDGYIMVVLLVGMAIAAVMMTAALPSWRQQVIREREAELVFRGEAIARAVYLYRQKNGQALPPSIDVLVSQRYLRKKYIDPITGKDFQVVAGTTGIPGGQAQGSGFPNLSGVTGTGQMQGGIIGVRSTSNDTSIRVYSNQTIYSQWPFDFTLEQLRAGGGTGTTGTPAPTGGRGGRGTDGQGEVDPITPRGGGFGGRGAPAPGGQRGGRGTTGPAIPGAPGPGGNPPAAPGGGPLRR